MDYEAATAVCNINRQAGRAGASQLPPLLLPLPPPPSVKREQDSWGWHGGQRTREQGGELRGWRGRSEARRFCYSSCVLRV